MTDHTPAAPAEKFVGDFMSAMDPGNPASMVFSMSTYQVFDEEAPTVVMAYAAGNLGIVMWNLLPGQENDYHLHPEMEHLQIVTKGEVEYTIGDEPPVTLAVGQAVLVPAGVAHGIRNTSNAPASYLAVTDATGGYEKVVVERNARP